MLPLPIIDHVVVNTQDQLDAAASVYAGLGFTLTPRGFHTLGSANHLAMFGTDYLELIGVLSAETARRDVLMQPVGLNGLVFATEDAEGVHAGLTEAGVAAGAATAFSRPVTLPEGVRDARFRTVHLVPEAVWPGRIYWCQHLTRDVVWRPEWQVHANGAVGVVRSVIASDDPGRLGGLFGRMFGAAAVRDVTGGVSVVAGLARVEVLTHGAVVDQFGAALPGDGRAEYMAGLTLRTQSLAQAEAATGLAAGGGRVLVPGVRAFGCVLEFVA